MSEAATLMATSREVSGSIEARRLRRSGLLPGIINKDGDIENSRLVHLDSHGFEQMLLHHRSESLVLDLSVDGADPSKVLLKEVQHHPVTGRLLHVDFIEISMTDKMRVRISVAPTGEPIGVSRDGGTLEQLVRDVEVECLPGDLPEQIPVDVSTLEVGQRLTAGDLSLPEGMELLTAPEIAVVAVQAPRKEEETTRDAAESEAAAGEEADAPGDDDKDASTEKGDGD